MAFCESPAGLIQQAGFDAALRVSAALRVPERAFGSFLAVALVLIAALPVSAAEPGFGKQVDLEPIRLIAVQHDGRVKTFDTLAREIVREITGSTFFKRETPGGTVTQDPVFTYLDLLFDNPSYAGVRLISIKKKPVRQAVIHAAGSRIDAATQEQILRDGRVSLALLQAPEVRARLDELSRDVMRTAPQVDRLLGAANLSSPRVLKELLRAVPPPGSESVQQRWLSVSRLERAAPRDATHAGLDTGGTIPGMPAAQQERLQQLWADAGDAWRTGNAAGASVALAGIAAELPKVAPAVYPPHAKLGMEHWYYKYHKMTWTWWFYMVAVVLLLMGIVYRWPRAWWAGAAFYGFALLLHTIATGVRWYLAGRIPNSNMFEAVTAAAWFGAAIAIFFEIGPALSRSRMAWRGFTLAAIGGLVAFVATLAARGLSFSAWQQWGPIPTAALIIVSVGAMGLVAAATGRRMATRGLALLGAAVMAMLGLMCGRFVMADLSDISNTMPVLNDVWLYIHVNMIIASYALIGIAYVTATMYVVGRLLTRPSPALWLSMLLPAVLIPLPPYLKYAVELVMRHPVSPPDAEYLKMMMPAWAPFAAVVVVALVCMLVRRIFGRAVAERSYSAWEGLPLGVAGVVGSAGSTVPPLRSGSGAAATAVAIQPVQPRGEGLARVLDGVTMLLLELSFITLWVGIITGAIWADHSWGRPWGWDPKEVFALNTWIIFLILVHVRLRVRDKALWTAVLTVFGMAVMMFNWIVVNFFITGLHSYAG